jgi:spore coat polysaccharide biosynthesis predicted glycosyltransferase SpsG
LNIETTSHEQVENFGCLLYDSDLAFVGGGTTMIEAACLGTPAVVLPQNVGERHFATIFAESGAVLVSPERSDEVVSMIKNTLSECADESIRRKMSDAGKRAIDGRGGERIIDALLSSFSSRKP